MSIISLRKEIYWNRWLLGVFFIVIMILDSFIHNDYEKFIKEKEDMKFMKYFIQNTLNDIKLSDCSKYPEYDIENCQNLLLNLRKGIE